MDRALLERMVGAVALVLLLVVVAPLLLDGTNGSGPAKFEGEPEEDVRTAVIVLNEPRPAQNSPETPVAETSARPEVIAPPPARVVEAPKQIAVPAAAVAESEETPAPASKPASKATPAATPSVAPVSQTATTAVAVDRPTQHQAPAKSVKPPPPPSAASPVATASAADDSAAGGFAVQLGSFGQLGNAEKLVADLKKRGFAVFVRSTPGAGASVHRVYAGPRPDRPSAEKLAVVLGDAGYKGIVVELAGKSPSGGR